MESDSFVTISSSNNSCVAFFPLIIHCVLIYILISVSLTQNCQARMVPSYTPDCELLILSSSMCSSVPYADGAPPQKLCFLVLESATDVLIWSRISEWGGFVFSLRNMRCLHAVSHPWNIWPHISLSTVTITTYSRGKCKQLRVVLWKWSIHEGIFFLVTIICQAIYLQNNTSFLGVYSCLDLYINIYVYILCPWLHVYTR